MIISNYSVIYYVVDNIIFRIIVPDYHSTTFETTFLRKFNNLEHSGLGLLNGYHIKNNWLSVGFEPNNRLTDYDRFCTRIRSIWH